MRLIYLFFVIILCLACTVEKDINSAINVGGITKSKGPKIFDLTNDEILLDIKRMFISDSNSHELFKRKSIILNLYCDTNTCKIDSIKVEGNNEFPYYSKRLINYFQKMSPIMCYDEFYRKKYSAYDILVGDWGQGLFLVIDYGYRPYEIKRE